MATQTLVFTGCTSPSGERLPLEVSPEDHGGKADRLVAEAKLDEIRKSAGEAWEHLRHGVREAWEELEQAVKQAVEDL